MLADKLSALVLFATVYIWPDNCHANDRPLPVRLNAAISVPLEARVGVLSAGIFCLPRGALRVSDFVPDDRIFGQIIEGEMSSRAPFGATLEADVEGLSIDLTHVDAKLCAKDWGAFGMGDTKSLTGRAKFSFAVSINRAGRDPLTNDSVIDVAVPRSLPLPLSMITREVMRRLFDDISKLSRDPSTPPSGS